MKRILEDNSGSTSGIDRLYIGLSFMSLGIMGFSVLLWLLG